MNPTPYRVWVSEIMLQQTQVGDGDPVLRRVHAAVSRRARARRRAARRGAAPLVGARLLRAGAQPASCGADRRAAITAGEFPQTSTRSSRCRASAARRPARSSRCARGQRHPILDGNVKRVLSRYFGVDGLPGRRAVEQRLWSLAEACTPQSSVDAYTQGIMDLGATVCTRARPACLLCPVAAGCSARAQGLQDQLPAARPRKRRPLREAWMVVAMRGAHKVLLERRPPSGIWGGMWGLPEFPTRAARGAMVPRAPVAAHPRRARGDVAAPCVQPLRLRDAPARACVAMASRRSCATTIATAGTTCASRREWGCRSRSRR